MEGKKLFVGNLASDVSEEELKEQFSYFGRVRSLRIIEKKRIGFVEMFHPTDAYRARLGLNGIILNGRSLRVEKALPRTRSNRSHQPPLNEQRGRDN